MKVLAVTACTAGIAHTYLVAEKLQKAAEELGHEIKVETQGSAGIENEITAEDVKNADVVIYAHDIAVRGTSRFAGKTVVDIPISVAMKQPKSLLVTIEKKLAAKKAAG
ncbi:MAG: PTS fructose transporter subunit IIB [Erysipelotrichales bacterium]|nr:PTS fructose transporter subunit IIB [Erysipelotrichales bacterium]MBQ1385981.1 PTS fructose transporter subunit IIB [Erysipelotrichales bacterium]MBQ2309631.1 PTS fructose transporter subunit IIB [Erysipelotrichales bacterium]MBQ2479415.1 PTS fructose transporter subunit IIB [Erysipelotrichales bacterium]MBQ4374549.1 PTS fructose transporter subunit IIB [Erysipelotrichales bacterium]